MAQDCAGSLQVCRLRVARLASDGAPDPGAGNLYVTDVLIRLNADPQVEAGQDFSLPNGCGENVVHYQDEDKITRLNLTMELAKPDPELIAILAGYETLLDGADVVGFKYPALQGSVFGPPVSLEPFSKAIVNGRLDAELPYWHWAYPWTEWRPAGGPNLENAALVTNLVGRGLENDNWGNGPANDWDQDSDRVVQAIRAADLPDAECGAQVLAAS